MGAGAMTQRDVEFTEYVTAHRRHLLRTAYLLGGDWTAAEDAVQIALAKLYAAWPRIQRGVGPDAYARRIVARTVVDEWRRPWRREVSAAELHDVGPPGRLGRSFEGAVTDRIDLVAALRRLPTRQRQVVVLRYWSGLSVAETAADLRISDGAVKSHASRALARLKSLLDENPERVS